MGFGLRFREKVKQTGRSSSQPDKNGFVPTSYERVQLTYDEAVKFAENLKNIKARLVALQTARGKLFRDVEDVLTGPLPRVHEIDPVTGEHTTVEPPLEGAANLVHQGTLNRITEEQEAKAQSQVYQPLEKWISEVDLFKGKMKILENLRLELDGSRRQHIQLENKIAKAEAKSVEVDPKHAAHIQSKDASVAGKRTAFEQYEAQLYEDLGNIISEAGVFHGALDKALQLEIEAFQRGLGPISSTTARLEAPPAPVTIAAPVTSGVAPTTAVPATTVAPTTAVAAPVAAKPVVVAPTTPTTAAPAALSS
jgi:hypothetical protein